MGSSKRVTVAYKVYLGMHQVYCHGPVDRLMEIKVDGKVAWSGVSTGGPIRISKEGLFGGEKREGGVEGRVDFEPGYPTQGQNSYLQSQIGSVIPAFRGVAGLVLRQVYLGLNPYLKKWAARMKRIHVRQDGLSSGMTRRRKSMGMSLARIRMIIRTPMVLESFNQSTSMATRG